MGSPHLGEYRGRQGAGGVHAGARVGPHRDGAEGDHQGELDGRGVPVSGVAGVPHAAAGEDEQTGGEELRQERLRLRQAGVRHGHAEPDRATQRVEDLLRRDHVEQTDAYQTADDLWDEIHWKLNERNHIQKISWQADGGVQVSAGNVTENHDNGGNDEAKHESALHARERGLAEAGDQRHAAEVHEHGWAQDLPQTEDHQASWARGDGGFLVT